MRSEKAEFSGAYGDSLAARLDLPDGQPRAYALFAHCFTCGKDILAASRIARSLTDFGIGVLRFDFTGLGSSEGEFANTSFSSNVGDLLAAAGYLETTAEAPKILIGHSLGGAAVLAAAAGIPEARAVATIGAPFDPEHVVHLFGDGLSTIEALGRAEVTVAGRSFQVRREFIDDLRTQKQTERLAKLGKALLVFHSPIDEIVGIDNASEIFGHARHPKSFVSLDRADHLLSKPGDADYVAAVLAAWASRFVDAEPRVPDVPGVPGAVVVQETGRGRYQQVVSVGPHRMLADEPKAFGGDDTGPGPYDLLLAALGACTSMTVRMYAQRKGWPLDNVSVTLRHEKIHAKDCEDCETKEGKIDRIDREIVLRGQLDGEQRSRLIEIADRCPVHRSLHSEVKVDTRSIDP